MTERRIDLNRLTSDQLAELLSVPSDQANRIVSLRKEQGGFSDLDDFVERFGIARERLNHPQLEFYVGDRVRPGEDPADVRGAEPDFTRLPNWSLDIALTPTPIRESRPPARLRIEYRNHQAESTVSKRHSMRLDAETILTIDSVHPDTELFVTTEDGQGNVLLPRAAVPLEIDEEDQRLRGQFELDAEVLEAARKRVRPQTKQRLHRRGRFRVPMCPEARFDDYDLAVDLVDSPEKLEAVLSLLSQEDRDIPNTAVLQLDPYNEQKMDQLTRFNLTGGDIKFDGAFEFSRPLPEGEEATVHGWFWLLMGPSLTVGFRREEHPHEPASRITLLLPFNENDGENASFSKKDNFKAHGGCGSVGGDHPLNVDEDSLLDHPDRFSDDPGPFCRPFENPNRIIGERTFHTILRVEEPEIASNSPNRPDYLLLLPEQRQSMAPVGRRVPSRRKTVLERFMPNARPGSSVTSFFRNPFQQAASRQPAGSGNLIDWEGDPTRHQAQSVAGGHVLEWRVQTRSNGYSLGDVQRTLTLAPRQTRRIVKVDWERRERARRQERTVSDDELEHEMERAMDYDTAVSSNLSEWSRGGSESRSTAGSGGLGFSVRGFTIGGGASHGRSSGSSWQRGGRSIAATEEQKLRDSIRQYGESLRRLESTVVTEAEQDETVEGVSETVRNINYSHSLTVVYYEIVRHLRVDTMLGGVRECLFVPFAITPFTEDRILRWRDVFQRHLRRRQLRWALRFAEEMAAVARVVDDPDYEKESDEGRKEIDKAWGDVPGEARMNHKLNYLSGSLWIRMAIERPQEGDAAEELEEGASEEQYQRWRERNITNSLTPFGSLLGRTIQETARRLIRADDGQIDDYFRRNVAPTMARNWVEKLQLYAENGEPLQDVNFTLASTYSHKGMMQVDFTLPQSEAEKLTRKAVEWMTVKAGPLDPDDEDANNRQSLPPGSIADCHRAQFHYETRHDSRRVNSSRRMRTLVQTGSGKPGENGASLYFPLSSHELREMRNDIKEAYDGILAHLNNNLHYYHRAIWSSMDRNELHTILDGYAISDADSRSLASVVEHEPIGVLGNSLIFRVAAGAFVGVDDHESLEEAFDYYNDGSRAAQPMRISLPTDGVYAQALMDRCNSSEEHHGSTDWVLDQEDPELAKLPDAILQSRRAQLRDLDPTSFPSPMINLQNAPSLPGSQGLSEALSGVTDSGAFRDMAGLKGTQQNTRAAMEHATGLAGQFGELATQLRLASEGAKAKAAENFDRERAALERAVEKDLISPEVARQALERKAEQMGEQRAKGISDNARELIDKLGAGRELSLTETDSTGTRTFAIGSSGSQQEPEEDESESSRWTVQSDKFGVVHFQRGADELDESGVEEVESLLDEIDRNWRFRSMRKDKARPATVVVEGLASYDRRDPNFDNIALAGRRAEYIRDKLAEAFVEREISNVEVAAVNGGVGPQRDDPAQYEMDRRVEVRHIYHEIVIPVRRSEIREEGCDEHTRAFVLNRIEAGDSLMRRAEHDAAYFIIGDLLLGEAGGRARAQLPTTQVGRQVMMIRNLIRRPSIFVSADELEEQQYCRIYQLYQRYQSEGRGIRGSQGPRDDGGVDEVHRDPGVDGIDFKVPGSVSAVPQPSDETCWAASYTMLYSWKHGKTFLIEEVMDQLGSDYRSMYDDNEPLETENVHQFMQDAGLEGQPPMSFTVEGFLELLKKYGPLWVVTDETPGEAFGLHARVITEMHGDGTAEGTFLEGIDPIDGQSFAVMYDWFQQRFQNWAASSDGPLFKQILHFPEGEWPMDE